MSRDSETAAYPGTSAVAELGWWYTHRWLLLRRLSQLSILVLFLLGPLAGVWVIEGNLSASMVLETVPLADPFSLSQVLAAGIVPAATALTGGAIVLAFYLLVGGRVFCSWVCPMNLVTDAASGLRRRLGIKGGQHLSGRLRYGVLAVVLGVAAVSGTLAWELVNPVSTLQRGLMFGMGFGWGLVALVFLYDLAISRHGWCGHLCPMGAFYALLGRFSLMRVNAGRRAECDDCMDCFAICPEPQVIRPALKGADKGVGPVIVAGECNNCGRCIDVCARKVFRFGSRFYHIKNQSIAEKMEVSS